MIISAGKNILEYFAIIWAVVSFIWFSSFFRSKTSSSDTMAYEFKLLYARPVNILCANYSLNIYDSVVSYNWRKAGWYKVNKKEFRKRVIIIGIRKDNYFNLVIYFFIENVFSPFCWIFIFRLLDTIGLFSLLLIIYSCLRSMFLKLWLSQKFKKRIILSHLIIYI